MQLENHCRFNLGYLGSDYGSPEPGAGKTHLLLATVVMPHAVLLFLTATSGFTFGALSALKEIDLNPIVGSNRGLRKHVEFDHAVQSYRVLGSLLYKDWVDIPKDRSSESQAAIVGAHLITLQVEGFLLSLAKKQRIENVAHE